MTGFRSRLPILLWLALLGVATWVVSAQTRVVTDLTLFLPRASDPVENLLVAQLRVGSASRLILVALEGAPSRALARTSAALVDRLRASRLFAYVNNGDIPWSPREQNLLLQNRYLLSAHVVPGRFATKALHESLEKRLRALLSTVGAFEKHLLPRDPTGEFQAVSQMWAGERRPQRKHGVWFSTDGKRALLLAETRAPVFDLQAQAITLSRIHTAFAESAETEAVRLVLSGPSVFAVAARNSIRGEVWRLTTLAIGLVAVLLLAVYRSARTLLLTGLPLLTGVLMGVAGVSLVFGSIHSITLAFGATVIGVAVDYPIHLFSHRKAGEAADSTMTRIWPTLRLSVLTTAIGYTAMLFSGFTGLSQLGLLAIVGLISAAMVTRWVLPVLSSSARTEEPPQRRLSIIRVVDQLRRLWWLSAVFIVVGTIYFVFLDHSPWETDIANLSPISARHKALDRALRAELGAPDVRKLFIVFGDSAEDTLQRSERLAYTLNEFVERRALTGFDAPSRYMPSKALQRQRQAALPTEASLRRTLREATRDLPFRKGLFEPFVADVVTARTSAPLGPADFQGTALGVRLSSLLFRQGTQWVALLPLRGVINETTLAQWVSRLNDSQVHYLDLKVSSNQLINRYRDEALMLLLWGAAAIVLVLVLGLPSLRVVLRVLLSVAAGVIGVVMLLLVFDQRLSLFHLVALLLVAGIGLDYGLFFNRVYQERAERERTARALAVCAATTMSVFGVLAVSETPVLNAIGTTTATGAILCLVLSATLCRDPTISTSSTSAGPTDATANFSTH